MAYKHIGVAISGNEEDALLVNKALELARHNCNDPLKSCSGHNEWRSQT